MSDITELYKTWETRWELSHPRPKFTNDNLLLVMQVGVATGAILLSGSRTGNVVSDIGALSDFARRIGVWSTPFSAIEAVLGFMTFDAGILLAGYLTGDDKADTRWYWVLFIASLIPALGANVYPGIKLINSDVALWGKVTVDILIGLFSPIMAFVAGRVIGATKNAFNVKRNEALKVWETDKNTAWLRSPEYRNWNKENLPKREVVRKLSGRREEVVRLLKGGQKRIPELARLMNLNETEMWGEILSLDGDVVRDGDMVKLADF